jgi:hypothetical protein
MKEEKKMTCKINPETTMLRPASMVEACAGGPLSEEQVSKTATTQFSNIAYC